MPKIVSALRSPSSGLFCFPGVTMYPDDARLTLAQAAKWFKLPKATINQWYHRGHLKDVVKDEHGQRLYRFDELLDAELATRKHPNSSRSAQRRHLVAV